MEQLEISEFQTQGFEVKKLDTDDFLSDELTAIYRAYDYRENHDTGVQEFKEDLCAIYLTDSFIESNIPEFTSVQRDFVNKIILMLGGD
ncbi:hypothetical protein MKN84_09890 [Streptococcus suis]|uniref:hypothetical protein n=1 Tax=Streptococcus parasuis TaxID=1501662 RepID=UPI00237828EB|nr:hypothetical protein [Streptococcus parasuis]MDG3181983.1 hypothetical protein [Streptococcus suis]